MSQTFETVLQEEEIQGFKNSLIVIFFFFFDRYLAYNETNEQLQTQDYNFCYTGTLRQRRGHS